MQYARNAITLHFRRFSQCVERWVQTVSRVCRARIRLQAVLAPWSGRTFNTAAISRELGVSRPTVVSYVQGLESEGLVHLLPFYGGTRRPLLIVGSSSRGIWAESIIARISQIAPESRFFWWKTGQTRVIELIADIGTERIGFRFLPSPLPRRRDWLPLDIASRRGVIRRGFLLYAGSQTFVVASVVQVLPLQSFMRDFEDWILHRQSKVRINYRRLARVAWYR